MIELAKEVADVRVEHPVHSLPFDPDRQRAERVVGFPPRPEPVGKTAEVHLVDGVQHLDDARWTILSSSVAMPSGRCRPSAFGMYERRDGLGR